MNRGAERLRARSARRLVARYAAAGGVLVLGAGAGWALGFSAPTTVAVLCIGLPMLALIQRFATPDHGRRRIDDRRPNRTMRHRYAHGEAHARGREP